MPPNQPSQSQPPANDYNFILQGSPKKAGLPMPRLNLPRPVKIGLVIILVLIILTVISASRGGGGSNLAAIDVAARQQEIVRVSTLAQSSLQDQQAQNLQANALAIMTSDRSQLVKALHIKSSDGRLAKYRNSSTDANLQTASQNNDYDQTYLVYLKQSLTSLVRQIQTAQASTGNAAGSVLSSELADAQSLLTAPQLTNL